MPGGPTKPGGILPFTMSSPDIAAAPFKPLRIFNPLGSLQAGFNDPTKPLPGETPFEYEYRQAVLQNARQLDKGVAFVGDKVKGAASYFTGNAELEQQKAREQAAAAPPAPQQQAPADAVFGQQSGPRPFNMDVAARFGSQFGTVTSTFRTPKDNERVGGVKNSLHLQNRAIDIARAPGVKHQDVENAYRMAGFQIVESLDEGDHSHIAFGGEGPDAGQYVNSMLAKNLTSPFDPRFMNAALRQVDAAQQAQMQPFSMDFQGQPMPEPPKPEPTPKMDFSASDAMLQSLKPAEITEKEMEHIKWKNFWSGLGTAMANSPEGEGLGSFFLRLGGGSLAAKGQSAADIERKKDLYEEKLAKWKVALYEHDFQKAQIQQAELLNDWNANNAWATEKYRAGMEVWSKTALPQLSADGTRMNFYNIDTATGKTTMVSQPIAPVIESAAALQRADIYSRAFGVDNQANAQVAGIANQIQGQIAMAEAGRVLGDPSASMSERAAAAMMGPTIALNYAISRGMTGQVLGDEEEAELLNKDVMKNLTQRGILPGQSGYEEAYNAAMYGRLWSYVTQSQHGMQRLMETFGPASQIYQVYEDEQEAKTTTRRTTDSRGRTTYQQTEVR